MMKNRNSRNEEESNSTISARSFQERKLCYRNLLCKVEEIEDKKDLGLQTVTEVGNILKEINELEREYSIEQRVEQTDETFLDCMVLSSSSGILVKCLNAVDISTASYEPTEFSEKLWELIKEDDQDCRPSDILKLLKDARNIIPEVEPYEFVYGSYDLDHVPEPKQKKVIKRDPKEKLTKKEPEKVTSVDKEEEGIDQIVKELHEVLVEEYNKNGERPINYYDYVIDTSDFTNTVENMFYCSFLVRDGKVRIDLNGLNPTIKPVSKNELKQFRDERGANYQILTTITMEDWENFKKEGHLQKHRKLRKKEEK
ncbi:EP300-interacting inhibitor of differentiation 3 [Coccinella septempunctata]|uniref:EP300-interacting inhibitor of differentiation 3 n=1 Tax=Coccinella septempunctata TaxID=41139 RepID=UPI001D0899CA|nr:EP300-interacting inhibitor of differentiation 3 [Coccinella septempunctata]